MFSVQRSGTGAGPLRFQISGFGFPYEVGRASDVLKFAAIESIKDDGSIFSCDISPNGKERKIFTLREPLSLITAGQEIAVPCLVPPKCEATILVHENGVPKAQVQPTDIWG